MAGYQPQIIRWQLLFAVLLPLTLVAVLFSLATGSVNIDIEGLLSALKEGKDSINYTLVMELRLPRALSAFVAGAMLALAGALMQVLLRNPLADPYVLGISGGAAVATLTAMLIGLTGIWLTGSALAGAFLSMILVFTIAHGSGSWTPTRLLLTGVVIAAGWGALISFILAITPGTGIHGMLFWLMGDLSQSNMPVIGFVVLFFSIIASLPLARHLNILSRGDQQASALGVNVRSVRIMVYVLASLLTASAVTIAGSIGFVGLIIPHMLRLAAGSDYRMLLPATVLAGGTLLVVADLIARTLIAPQQLPTGVITALIGVPLFLFLLHRSR